MLTIREEIKQTRPFANRSEEAVVALMRTADLVRRAVGAVVEPAGLTVQQYNVLRILRGAGERGLPTLEIAQRMIEQTPGITRLIDRLEAKLLVRRERCLSDRRQVFCRITSEGLELLARLDHPVRQADEKALESLGEQDLVALLDLLGRTRNHLSAAAEARRRKSTGGSA